jgi:cobalt/nickel transport system ATP-binding protein
METPKLKVSGLGYSYPDGNQALDNIDLIVNAGERVALLGPNGAGKTTLVMHLNGILHGGKGSIEIDGSLIDPNQNASLLAARQKVGIVFQDPDDQLFMPTVGEDIAFGPQNYGVKGQELEDRVVAALALVKMSEFRDRAPHHLSFGQRRRVAVATVLAMQPEILVLDEPSSNLDPAARRELFEILQALPVTILMVTHDLPYAMQICPRSVIISAGNIVADGSTIEILRDETLLNKYRLELPEGFAF